MVTNNGSYSVRENYLSHYGVLGMRWGIRRGHSNAAYEKASKKLRKISLKVDKFERKANNQVRKADANRYSFRGSEERAAKHDKKAAKYSYKASRQMQKAIRWCNQMDKAFSKTSIQRSQSQIDLGKEYMQKIDMRTAIRTVNHY